MRAEEYLDQIKKLDAIIINKSERYRQCVEQASGLGDFSVGERVQRTRNLQQIPDAIAKYIDLEREIEDLKEKRAEIIKTIERLPFVEYKTIYILFVKEGNFTLKDIAWEFNMGYDWAKKRKAKALRMVQAMLDEKRG